MRQHSIVQLTFSLSYHHKNIQFTWGSLAYHISAYYRFDHTDCRAISKDLLHIDIVELNSKNRYFPNFLVLYGRLPSF